MCDWDNDIETGNISTMNATAAASQHSNMTPQCMSPLTLADLENDDDTELHTPPSSRATVVPDYDDDYYYSSNCSQVEIQVHDCEYHSDDISETYYETELINRVDTFNNLITRSEKHWITVNCCGNA